MARNHAEVRNPRIRQQLLTEQTRSILDKNRVGRVQLGKGLFILTLYHDLSLGRHGAAAGLDQVLEPQHIRIIVQQDRHPRNRALRMRRGQLVARGTCMLGQLKRTRACAGIDVIEVDDLLTHAATLHQLKRHIVILIACQARAQAADFHRKGEPHLDTRIKALQIGDVIVQRRFDHLETERAFRMFVKTAHDAGHVDALLIRLKAHRACDGCLKRQRTVITALKPHRQTEIGNPHMLDLLVRPFDKA